jgi:hypothetical protein
MMVPFFNYGTVTPFLLTKLTTSWLCPNPCQIMNYLTFGQIAENPVITPSSSVQVVRASAPNRFLNSVTVNATTPPTP